MNNIAETLNYKDYMYIDELLRSDDLLSDLTLFAGSDVELRNLSNQDDFELSADELNEYIPKQMAIQERSVSSPISYSQESRKSTETSECSSKMENNDANGMACKSVPFESELDSSKARISTWKVSKDKSCLETSVEFEGVSYTYNLVPTSKGRKPRGQRQSVPGSQKDTKYWDRRFKNNKAAKRSRDLRRRKEMLVASRVVDLETENEELKAEVTFLRERVKLLNKKLQEKTV